MHLKMPEKFRKLLKFDIILRQYNVDTILCQILLGGEWNKKFSLKIFNCWIIHDLSSS